MKYINLKLSLLLILSANQLFSQTTDSLTELRKRKEEIHKESISINKEIEYNLLKSVPKDLKSIGYPKINNNEQLVEHDAMVLAYNNWHEQAAWVMHKIPRDIKGARLQRSNDFRSDSLVANGSATEKDYFLRYPISPKKDSFYSFGYDRGHLAPSADFTWSAKAMSQSYYYSNMSPQVPEFNEGKWAELENNLRNYVNEKQNTDLYVVTGPILHQKLKKVPQASINLSVPEFYFKVAIDTVNKQGIAYLMSNRPIYDEAVADFACSIDSIEQITGHKFFPNLDKKLQKQLKSSYNSLLWKRKSKIAEYMPINPKLLKLGQCNTLEAKKHIDSYRRVCGTFIKTNTKNGNIYLNLDRVYPDEILTVMIPKKDIAKFEGDIFKKIEGKQIGIQAKINQDYKEEDRAIIFVNNPNQITLFEEKQ